MALIFPTSVCPLCNELLGEDMIAFPRVIENPADELLFADLTIVTTVEWSGRKSGRFPDKVGRADETAQNRIGCPAGGGWAMSERKHRIPERDAKTSYHKYGWISNHDIEKTNKLH